jgi:urease accessory protein
MLPPVLRPTPANDAPRAPPCAPARWRARLELDFAAGASGTRLVSNRHEGPLRLLKALPSGDRSRLEAVVVHPPGGLVGGDHLEIDLRLAAGSRVLATTPGAQKWYRAATTAAASTVLSLAAGTTLEWLPQPSILYDGARARQVLSIRLATGGRCLGWEVLIRGRDAMGEVLRSGHVDQTLSIQVDGVLQWHERLSADAADRLFDSPIGWDRRRVAASVWCCVPGGDPLALLWLRDRWRGLLDDAGSASARGTRPPRGGATVAAEGLLLAKLLDDDAERLMSLCRRLWEAARISLDGTAGSTPRIWQT